MNTLHERLVATIDGIADGAEWGDACGPLAAALRAVVELHRPASDEPQLCSECWDEATSDYRLHPCSTIRTIAEALGVTTEGDHRG